MRGKQGSAASPIGKDTRKYFSVTVNLLDTSEKYILKKVYNEMTIRHLKEYTEFVTGIPYNIQRLTYLDEGDLMEHTDVRHNDIVPGAILTMRVWHTWRTLMEAAASNDTEWLFQLGVTEDGSFKTPNSEVMSAKAKKEWIAERAFAALFIAAHRGHMKLCSKLLEAGANINASTSLGRTALHVAAAQGHSGIVDMLLGKGANINATDRNGDTALTVAGQFGHKGCERHLFLFRWQERAQTVKPNVEHEMFAHQYYDSAFPVWLKGDHGQVYFTNILPPNEYEGTRLDAPRRSPLLPTEKHAIAHSSARESRSPNESPECRYAKVKEQADQKDTRKEALPRARVKSPGAGKRMTPIAESVESRRQSGKATSKGVKGEPIQHSRKSVHVPQTTKTIQAGKSFKRDTPKQKGKVMPASATGEEKAGEKTKSVEKKSLLSTSNGQLQSRDDKNKDGLVRDWLQHKDKKWSAYDMWQRRNEIDLIEEIRAGNIPESMKMY